MTFGTTFEKVLNGSQNQVRQPIERRFVYRKGKVYGVQAHVSKEAVAFIKVISVREQPLGAVTEAEANAEGHDDLAAFIASWIERYGKFDPTEEVWRIEFKLVDESELGSYDLYRFNKREDKPRRKK